MAFRRTVSPLDIFNHGERSYRYILAKDCVSQVTYIIGKKSSIFVISNLVVIHQADVTTSGQKTLETKGRKSMTEEKTRKQKSLEGQTNFRNGNHEYAKRAKKFLVSIARLGFSSPERAEEVPKSEDRKRSVLK